ncbi:pyrroline-5-carboxylate reductase [Cryptococcus amylolentus CBS 6039]|uniref:Pyrroline-5-carboxylate reductase n=2 Tax=Cryptococcus amylolentus TaxID=104669 RepID=A0A1E3HZF2_9TREE|nr:pyrroline-5-carboxylate reductase [Cryptococcus amylolentus CBS 6039]ODN80961.1 pyrroline-5-carboxylate reductase [Cryptococcus amylolentus CBS 6039]ODO09442.1 pyrroline-5-carboxylate reductase [Cryptococcus amylolentus CBS 6273]
MGYTLAVVGCGTMGVAILSGVFSSLEERQSLPPKLTSSSDEPPSGISTPTASQFFDAPEASLPSRFIATTGREETARKLRKTLADIGKLGQGVDVHAGDGNLKAVQEADVVLVCSKPNIAKSILEQEGMGKALEGKLVISICAGVKISQLKSWVPESTTIVRAMPNTPCKIGEGMTVVTPVSDAFSRTLILNIFTSCGRCRFLDEKHFDAATALAGSGPAFVALVLEAMTDGGVMMGLPRSEAVELAAQTMQGTGRMVLSSGQHPAQLKDSVTTPGGCTMAGLLTMEDGRVRSTMARAIQVATNHAAGLGQEKK